MDSHTDTCVIGRNALVFHEDPSRFVNVTPFAASFGTMDNKPIVDAALAYDNPITGETCLLLVHQAILMEEMDNNLLCPMQIRTNDVRINECPKFLSENPNKDPHSIHIPDEDFRIPLQLNGVTSYFTRKPTLDEWNTCRRIDLTYEAPDWNPHSITFEEQENAMYDGTGSFRDPSDRYRDRNLFLLSSSNRMVAALTGKEREKAQIYCDRHSKCSSVLSDLSNTLNDDSFYQSLVSQRNVSYTQVSKTTSTKKNIITADRLAATWNIGIESAKRTLKATTQRGIRTLANSAISCRFRTNDRQLRYQRLMSSNMSLETLEGSRTPVLFLPPPFSPQLWAR
jgi:hypothetical protein